MHHLRFSKRAAKALLEMPRLNAERIRRQLKLLVDDPGRRDMDIVALQGRAGFRLRVGDMRIIFERNDRARVIDVLRIAPRGQVYRQ